MLQIQPRKRTETWGRSCKIGNIIWSHPTVRVAPFGPKVSDRLSSLSEEPAVRTEKLLVHSF